ncbi:hypothetical protein GCM10008908_29000 [Clostridium subterminale]|uniref:ATP synthase F0 subunit 8 n=1 Tax=Clostridium subterminale TaxID=1550 RepID=A0ABN1KUA6_CLOSU
MFYVPYLYVIYYLSFIILVFFATIKNIINPKIAAKTPLRISSLLNILFKFYLLNFWNDFLFFILYK